MEHDQVTRLVSAWIAHSCEIQDDPASKPTFWAWCELDQLCQNEPKTAWALILEILNLSDDEFVLENLAAGPLESLLAYHGLTVISLVEERAEADTRFRWLLAGVWQNRMPSSIWARVQSAAANAEQKIPLAPKFRP